MHPQQLNVYHDCHRFQIVKAGRRWGKTELAWIKALIFMLAHPGCLIWWIAPFYKELIPATAKIRKLTPRSLIAKQLESSEVIRFIRLVNGSECFFHSADKEDTLRGSGLHGVVIDEAGSMKRNRVTEELLPSLIDFHGWLFAIGTPKGINWFDEYYRKGQDPKNSEYKSWMYGSYGNSKEQGGFIDKVDIDFIASQLPELTQRQEILGETLQGEGVVFRHIADRIRSDIAPICEGEVVAVGSDLAKSVDYYVNVAVRLNGEVVGFERYHKLDWPLMRKRSVEFCKRHNNASLLIDSTGVGDPVFDELTMEYADVQGYKLTNLTKKQLIENLSIMLDNGEIWFSGDPETKEFSTTLDGDFPVLKSELESYTYSLTQSGLISYNAPEGLHDDTVIALALAAYQIKNSGPISGGVADKAW
jgi:hypothetical protein